MHLYSFYKIAGNIHIGNIHININNFFIYSANHITIMDRTCNQEVSAFLMRQTQLHTLVVPITWFLCDEKNWHLVADLAPQLKKLGVDTCYRRYGVADHDSGKLYEFIEKRPSICQFEIYDCHASMTREFFSVINQFQRISDLSISTYNHCTRRYGYISKPMGCSTRMTHIKTLRTNGTSGKQHIRQMLKFFPNAAIRFNADRFIFKRKIPDYFDYLFKNHSTTS